MIKVVIIEDETFAAEALENMILELRPEMKVLAHLSSVEESAEWFQKNRHPDLIFCDIHLLDGSSFEIFNAVEVKVPVIFITAYNEYAIKAFKVNSIDYLLKPINKEELQAAIEKFESLQQDGIGDQIENLKALLQQNSQREKRSRFMVKSGQSIKVIPAEEVAYFLAEEGIVLLVNFNGKRFAVNYSLDELEKQLDTHRFFRANRQIIVSIDAVEKAESYFKGRLLLQTNPRTTEDQVISSSKAGSFKEWLEM